MVLSQPTEYVYHLLYPSTLPSPTCAIQLSSMTRFPVPPARPAVNVPNWFDTIIHAYFQFLSGATSYFTLREFRPDQNNKMKKCNEKGMCKYLLNNNFYGRFRPRLSWANPVPSPNARTKRGARNASGNVKPKLVPARHVKENLSIASTALDDEARFPS